jgi:predicted Zn-dependent protease
VTATLLSLALLGAQLPAVKPVQPLPSPHVLVVPFQTPPFDGGSGRPDQGRGPSGDAGSYWLGEGVAMLVADDIDARGLGAITRAARVGAYEQLHLPPNAVLSRATVIKVGQIVGAAQVIVGEVSVEDDTLTVRIRPIRIDVGRADAEVTERGPIADLFSIVRRATARAVPGGGPAPTTPPTSPQAFEQYVKGLLAEKPAAQAEFLDAALRVDPNYTRARFALWDVFMSEENPTAALAALKGIDPSSENGPRAQFLTAVAQIALKRYDDAFNGLKALSETLSDAAVLNDLGVVQIRRGGSAESGKPVYYFTKAAEASPNDADILFNLGYAYALDRDPQAALYWLRETLRRNPADADAHYVLAAELDSAGSSVEAGRERELAAQLSAKWAERRSETLPRGLDRLRQDLESRRATVVDQALVTTTQRDQRDVAQFHLERGRRLFEREQDREAMAELRRAVFLSPYEAEAHLLIGRIHLRGGRPREAVDALKISIWSRDTAAARLTLAEAYLQLKDIPSARAQAQKALTLDPGSAEAKRFLEKIGPGHL